MRRFLLTVLTLPGFVLPLCAQVTPTALNADSFVQNLKTATANMVVEKTYLHFDRACYTAGDTIYFKAYVTSGEKHEPTKVSAVLHADLLSDRDSVMQSLLLHVQNGVAAGDFALPAYLHKGNYRIRAYTQWMRNRGDSSFFYRSIPVNGNAAAATAAKLNGKPDIQFFAEAGTFVAGIPVRMVFKAVGNNGLGIDAQGVVVDNNDVAVAKFKSAHLGMGQFYLTAAAGKTYRAKVTFADGSTATIDLPKPEAKGIAMMVNNTDTTKFSVDINTTKPYYLENKDKNITIVISAAGVAKTVKTALDNQIIGFDMPKKDFPSGVATIILFGPDGNEVGERMLFIQGNDGLNLAMNTDKQNYNAADKATLNLNVQQNDGVAAKGGSFSVSVVNEGKEICKDTDGDNILSYLLLTSDIRGYVEQPGYYFDKMNADTRNNLDILMLTQGYHSLIKIPAARAQQTAYKAEGSLQLSGKLATREGKPLANEKLSVVTDANQSAITTTDAAGNFAFNNVEFANGSKFILNVESNRAKKNAVITINKTYTAIPVSANKQPVNEVNMPAYTPATDMMVVNNKVGVRAKNSKVGVSYHTSNLAGPGTADQVIFRKNIPSSPTLSQGLQNVAKGVDFAGGKAYLRAGSAAFAGTETLMEPMLVVIDGVVLGKGSIDNVLISEVDNVEILKGANSVIYGLGAGSGVIIINTRQGGADSGVAISTEMAPGMVSVTPQGYYVARTFYNPLYSPTLSKNMPEHPTVFWKADVSANDAGKAAINFNNAGAGTYRVVLEGIDANGHLGRAVYRYSVK